MTAAPRMRERAPRTERMAMTAMVEPERREVRELSAAEVAVAVEDAVGGKKDAEGEREGAKVLSVEPEALVEEGVEEEEDDDGEEEGAEDAADAEVDCMDTVADADADADVDVDADSDAIEDEESAATELADADAADRWETHRWSQRGSRCTGAYRDARRGPGEARNGVERVEWADGRGF